MIFNMVGGAGGGKTDGMYCWAKRIGTIAFPTVSSTISLFDEPEGFYIKTGTGSAWGTHYLVSDAIDASNTINIEHMVVPYAAATESYFITFSDTAATTYTDSDYAIMFDQGDIEYWESGASVVAPLSTYTNGNRVRIELKDGSLNIYQNDSLIKTVQHTLANVYVSILPFHASNTFGAFEAYLGEPEGLGYTLSDNLNAYPQDGYHTDGYYYKLMDNDIAWDERGLYAWEKYDPNVFELPNGYSEVEYLQASANCAINTGIVPNGNTRLKIKFNASGNGAPFGSEKAFQNASYAAIRSSTSYYCYATQTYSPTISTGVDYTVDFNGTKLTINGSLVKTFTAATISTTYPLYLFVSNRAGKTPEPFNGKIYSRVEIYQDGTNLSGYFIACKDTDGNLGMYNTVTQTMHYNIGSGSFTTGGEITIQDNYDPIGYVIGNEENAYPNDGFADDGYYYVKVGATKVSPKYASGSTTAASGGVVTVSGLGFKPNSVFIHYGTIAVGMGLSDGNTVVAYGKTGSSTMTGTAFSPTNDGFSYTFAAGFGTSNVTWYAIGY